MTITMLEFVQEGDIYTPYLEMPLGLGESCLFPKQESLLLQIHSVPIA